MADYSAPQQGGGMLPQSMSDLASGFIDPSLTGGQYLNPAYATPAQRANLYALSTALQQPQQIKNGWQGIASMVKALIGGYYSGQADRMEQGGTLADQQRQQIINQVSGANGALAPSGATSAPAPYGGLPSDPTGSGGVPSPGATASGKVPDPADYPTTQAGQTAFLRDYAPFAGGKGLDPKFALGVGGAEGLNAISPQIRTGRVLSMSIRRPASHSRLERCNSMSATVWASRRARRASIQPTPRKPTRRTNSPSITWRPTGSTLGRATGRSNSIEREQGRRTTRPLAQAASLRCATGRRRSHGDQRAPSAAEAGRTWGNDSRACGFVGCGRQAGRRACSRNGWRNGRQQRPAWGSRLPAAAPAGSRLCDGFGSPAHSGHRRGPARGSPAIPCSLAVRRAHPSRQRATACRAAAGARRRAPAHPNVTPQQLAFAMSSPNMSPAQKMQLMEWAQPKTYQDVNGNVSTSYFNRPTGAPIANLGRQDEVSIGSDGSMHVPVQTTGPVGAGTSAYSANRSRPAAASPRPGARLRRSSALETRRVRTPTPKPNRHAKGGVGSTEPRRAKAGNGAPLLRRAALSVEGNPGPKRRTVAYRRRGRQGHGFRERRQFHHVAARSPAGFGRYARQDQFSPIVQQIWHAIAAGDGGGNFARQRDEREPGIGWPHVAGNRAFEHRKPPFDRQSNQNERSTHQIRS